MPIQSDRKTYYRGYWILPVYIAEERRYVISTTTSDEDALPVIDYEALAEHVPGDAMPLAMTMEFDSVEEAKNHIAQMTGQPRERQAHGRRRAGY